MKNIKGKRMSNFSDERDKNRALIEQNTQLNNDLNKANLEISRLKAIIKSIHSRSKDLRKQAISEILSKNGIDK